MRKRLLFVIILFPFSFTVCVLALAMVIKAAFVWFVTGRYDDHITDEHGLSGVIGRLGDKVMDLIK